MFLIRVPHSSGMLEGNIHGGYSFSHRMITAHHRPRSWLLNGVKKVEQLRFLERGGERTLGQAAILWLLADDRVASVLPNIYDSAQLREFVEASDKPRLSSGGSGARLPSLVAVNFGLEPEEPKFKGTMDPPEELVTA